MPRVLQPCGTYGAFQRHVRRGEECDPCRLAMNTYKREYEERRRGPRRELKPCGTPAAYRRHLRHGTEPCADCRRANARQNVPSWKGET